MTSAADPPPAGERAPLSSLEVVKEIVRELGLRDAEFTLVSHSVHADRRQRHRAARERLADAARELLAEPAEPPGEPIGQRVRGSRLLDLSLGDLDAFRLARDHVVSISSRFERHGSTDHLPLMDICLESLPDDVFETVVDELCGRRRYRLVRTDRHYHLYGFFVLSELGWKQWNAGFQATNVLTDGRYVTQSLLRGCNLLRLNAGELFQRTVPVMEGAGHRPPGPLSEAAVELARRRHDGQFRKSGESILRHLEEVAGLAVEIGGECAPATAASLDQLYACGYLHDCIEDTNTDYDDVADASGVPVADMVVDLSEDKRLPARPRHRKYLEQITKAGLPARTVKLADLLSNLRGLRGNEEPDWIADYLRRVESQLHAISPGLEGCRAFGEARCLVERWRNLCDALTVPGKPLPVESAQKQQQQRLTP